MKASVIISLLWAGLASASACRPSKASSSSLSPSSSLSSSPSSSLSPSSSSSSVAPSASPDPNLAAADSNIAANINGHWDYGGNDGSMVATTCVDGDPVNSCLVYTLGAPFSEDYLMYITYYAPTLVQGTTYTFSFDMMRDAGNSGYVQLMIAVSYTALLLNTNIDISAVSSTDWTPQSSTFEATAADDINFQLFMNSAPTAEHLKFRNFRLVAV